jgi:hypothetical protein
MADPDISVKLRGVRRLQIKDVARLDVKPGETLCFWFEDLPRDPETGEPLDLAAALKGSLPDGVKVIALEGNVGVGILSAADISRVTHPLLSEIVDTSGNAVTEAEMRERRA